MYIAVPEKIDYDKYVDGDVVPNTKPSRIFEPVILPCIALHLQILTVASLLLEKRDVERSNSNSQRWRYYSL